MHIHILGICGTFMAGIAALARDAGHRVTGSDANVYPPMSDQLRALGIKLAEGYRPDNLDPVPDCVVVGNALSRGNPEVEAALDRGLDYCSGPEWLARHVLRGRHVIAAAGTHGKTSTASMLAWILDCAGQEPGYLIGGIPRDFDVSARRGGNGPFVVEADEYDTAFFDKRSKFVHYRPKTAILANLEFDHADIFDDLAAIRRQFHHLVRTVPGSGRLLVNGADPEIGRVLEMGSWTPVERFGLAPEFEWQASDIRDAGRRFTVIHGGRPVGEVHWNQTGNHSVLNGLAAIAAAEQAGVSPGDAAESLSRFAGVKRRMEVLGRPGGITVYDDFAHHPTAIRTTLDGLRAAERDARIIVALELRSNTMQRGVHADAMAESLSPADHVVVYRSPELGWDPAEQLPKTRCRVEDTIDAVVTALEGMLDPGDHLVIMSNGGFGGLHSRMLERLARRDSEVTG